MRTNEINEINEIAVFSMAYATKNIRIKARNKSPSHLVGLLPGPPVRGIYFVAPRNKYERGSSIISTACEYFRLIRLFRQPALNPERGDTKSHD